MRITKKVQQVPTAHLEQSDGKDEEEEEIPITRPRPMHKPSSAKLVPKYKTVATYPEKMRKS